MTDSIRLRVAVTAVALFLAGAASAPAQERLDTSLAVRGGLRLAVMNPRGSITIRGGGRSQIRIQADADRSRVQIEHAGGRVSVRTVQRRSHGDVDYHITVPGGTAIEINGISADVDVSGVCGELQLNTVSGDIAVECAEGLAVVQSVSGDVSIAQARGDVDAGSTSGDLNVRRVRGNVNARTVSGDINLSEIGGSDVGAETVSGDVRYAGPIRDGGRYAFRAHSGDVEVRVAGTLNAAVSVSTFSGDFSSDYQVEIQPGTVISRDWQFRVGNGGARLRLESFSGGIYLRRGLGGARED
jgi:DUF4097 and DUF4098 domain-containing protein YvlB